MKTSQKIQALAVVAILSLFAGVSSAQQPASAATVSGKNSIETVKASQVSGNLVVRVTLKEPLGAQVGSFSVSNPSRVAIDFPGTLNGTGRTAISLNEGDLRSANLVQVADRTRLVLNLARTLSYSTSIEGRDLVITLAAATAKSPEATTTARFAEQQGGPDAHKVRDVNFRRGKDGEGRVVVDLSDANTGIDIRQQGGNLVVEFLKTALPDNLRRSLDVTDFATPVNTVVTTQNGTAVRMVISPKGLWEHNAYQTDSQFVIEVKAVKEDPNKLVQGSGRTPKYAGEKLSLNFQNIDVRSVLQVIADFTNFNIITSDSVSGALTLRLKDVPWDQALEIILQAKGLDMRKNGNVIWIAPRDELAAREKLELDSKAQIADLEPLRTENFQINYHKATAIFDFLTKKENTMLSKRGVVIVDERSNKLFVTDVAARLEELRRIIGEIDVPVKQVLIEAQIVEASDSFARNLGVRLSFLGLLGNTYNGLPKTTVGAGIGSTSYQAGIVETKPNFLTDGQAVNLPAPAIAGKAAGQISSILYNAAGTRYLGLEISALEADGRGKIVSRPRVMTSDQMEALIEQGVELPYQLATSSGATAVSFRKANLSLKVKPQVTPDGRIALTVDVNKDSPNTLLSTSSGIAIDTKHVSTQVLVENGGTVVLGGIYQQDTKNITNKIPLLGDLPILGYLFRENERSDTKTELLVFITPRILTEQTALR
ncbi:type IV pilus secretin PilQ [Uliginosibacterium sp. H3]|uniref:Type IV pilus biogenesis and competence protein PilQ n=1 Tax=Uliginosibacterium silvisoli TaxID=3114758 RepID=A0ABU6JYY9_9RHOO|nr:type IV pilus secretin PilQ [Uliginosibacterium sp. H3]